MKRALNTALSLLLLTWLLGTAPPAYSADLIMASVRSQTNAELTAGTVTFYASCADHVDDIVAAQGAITPMLHRNLEVNVAPGTYWVRIESTGGTDAAKKSWHGGAGTCEDSTAVTVPAVGVLQLTAQSNRAVSGTARVDTSPVTAAWVEFYASCYDYDAAEPMDAQPVGPDGSFTVHVPDGAYRVLVRPQTSTVGTSWNGGKLACEQAKPVTVAGSGTADLTFLPGFAIGGGVTSAAGDIDNAQVLFFGSCDDVRAQNPFVIGEVDQGDPYDVVLAPGTYYVRIYPYRMEPGLYSWNGASQDCETSTPIVVTGTDSKNLTVIPAPTRTGTAVDETGTPITGDVFFYDSCQDYYNDEHAAEGIIMSGAYRVAVPDGTYKVRFRRSAGDSWHSAKASCAQADMVTVSGSQGPPLVAAKDAVLAGSVTAGGNPAKGTLKFYPSCEDVATGSAYTRQIVGGSYGDLRVPKGSYKVQLASASFGMSWTWLGSSGECADSPTVTVSGNDSNRNFDFMGVGSLRGTLTRSDGLRLHDATVAFYRSCAAYALDDEAGTALTNSAGDYQIYIAPGTYKVAIYAKRQAATSWNNQKADCASADTITVSDITTYDLVALTGARLSGSVTSSKGPVASADLVFFGACEDFTHDRLAGRTSVARSKYAFRIIPGTYRVLIDPDPGTRSMTSWHSAKPSCDQASQVVVTGDAALDLVALPYGWKPPVVPPVEPPRSPPGPQAKAQTVKKPPATLKVGRKAKLAAKTSAGTRITWKSLTTKKCVVKKGKLLATKKGKCKLSAKAPPVSGFGAFSKRFVVRIR